MIAESHEAGGHVRENGLSTFALVPQVVDAVRCPVFAAGGICDARGFVAALALGAHGVQMGTRFVATDECEAHPSYKRALVDAQPEDGVVYSRHHHASRGLATAVVRRMVELEREGAPMAEVLAVRGRDRARLGCVEGDLDEGICPAGAAVGMVREILPVEALLAQIIEGYAARIEALGALLASGRNAA